MKKVLFLVSHFCSGSDQLYRDLNEHICIQGFEDSKFNSYQTMLDVFYLTQNKHKLKNSARVYMDHLLYNNQFSCSESFKNCKFIFMVREPESSIERMVASGNFDKNYAVRYYAYRLRRICEMAKKARDYLFLTYSNFKNDKYQTEIKKFLGIKDRWEYKINECDLKFKNVLTFNELNNLNITYEKYLYFINNINTK